MRIFAVSGYSGTGKTALIEILIRELVREGFSVATMKSSKHELGPEKGTDTWRHKQAGASTTLFLKTSESQVDLRERIGNENLEMLAGNDFLIIEGMKTADIPKFWCIGDTDFDLDDVPAGTQAVVTWSIRPHLISDIPIFTHEDVSHLVEIVKTKSESI
ncbi:MAG: molybdopterin-guanine dinucleotide biosynthesis protein B [Candidatus Thorarchaeota archaeon]